MGKCAHCGGGKARRSCPALDAYICGRCCSEHQRREFHCPEGCSFLRHGPSPRAYQSAIDKLLEFTMELPDWCEEAAKAYFGRRKEMDEWEESVFIAYLAYGYANKNGERAVDIFVREHGARLRADELAGRPFECLGPERRVA